MSSPAFSAIGNARNFLTAFASIACAGVAIFAPEIASAQTATALNDTGIIICYGPTAPCDPAVHKKQDAMIGRDPAARTPGSGLVTNTGKGFSFTKISNGGQVVPDNAVQGLGAGEWACTRDNVTGLIWETKTDVPTNVRHYLNTYTWFNPDPAKNGGNAGFENGGGCSITGRCDTDKYILDKRAGQGHCGRTDWRLPTTLEFVNLMDYGRESGNSMPMNFFPNVAPHASGSNSPAWFHVRGLDPTDSASTRFVQPYFDGQALRFGKIFAASILAVAGQ